VPFAGDYFDVVTAFDVIEHLKNPCNMLSEAYRILKNKDYLYYQRLILLVGQINFCFSLDIYPLNMSVPASMGKIWRKDLFREFLQALDM
jgi:ubiquinone/menaquinone biosynthesis C-methylase UbiE